MTALEIPVQINGKIIKGFWEGTHGLQKLRGTYIKNVVVIPYKLVNIVAIPMILEEVPVEIGAPNDPPIDEVPL